MKINITFKKLFFFVLLSLLISQKSVSQCFQIESILVDACSATDEGKNEMVRFKIGPTAQNVNNLVVVWPNNAWQGLIQDTNTAAKVALINQDIDDANGCGNLLEPAGGVLPANAKVILVTSQDFSVAANPFGALTEDTYIIFQETTTIPSGHFANYSTNGTILRTLTMSFGTCTDAVTYNKTLLIDQSGNNAAADGATVNFNANGDATYINNGCAAPVVVSTVDAGSPTVNVCTGGTITLNGSATGQTSVTWSAPSGTFTAANSLSTDYQITAPAGTVVVLTLTAYNGLCTITDTIELTVKPIITPDFATTLTVCNGASAPALNNTSPNGINGTWTPAVISNTIGGTYNFVPTAGQCANPTQVVVTIDNFCDFGSFASAVKLKKSINCNTQTEEFYNTSGSGLNLIAPIANDFNNSFLGVYQKNSSNLILKGGQIKTFKSTGANVCGVKLKYRVYLTSSIGTTFSQIECPFYDNCVGGSFPTLGPCNPGDQKWEEIGNNLDLTTYAPGNYTIELFYEVNGDNNSTSACNDTQIVNNSGVNFKANFTIQNTPLYTGNNPITCNGSDGSITVSGLSPNTNYSLTYTDDAVVVGPSVFTTNANGNILISNLNAGNYNNFNLNINGCDYQIDFLPPVVLVNPTITSTFTAVAPICAGATLSPLSITSLEGITGIWSPALNNNATTNYVFTAGAGQCAVNGNLTITVTPATQPTFTAVAPICAGATLSPLPTTSLEGITGTWSPALNNNATTNYVFTIDAGQCALNGSLTITVDQVTQPTFTAVASICAGATISPLPSTSLEGITGTWSPALNNNATTNYVFTSGVGQCALNGDLTITVNPDFDFTIKNECINGDFTLLAEPINNSYDASMAEYKWKDAIGNTIGTNDATLNVTSLLNMTPSTETFPITYFLTITSQEGCAKPNTGFVVNDVICKIPKGISPGVVDGKNDSFDLTGFNVEKIEIFNRYGTEVFSYGAYTDQWHGQASGGEDLPDGTYFYVINRKGGITTTGWIYINRQY